MPDEPPTNVIRLRLGVKDGRHEVWIFPDGTKVEVTVPDNEPPITVERAVFCLSSIIHQIHSAMLGWDNV